MVKRILVAVVGIPLLYIVLFCLPTMVLAATLAFLSAVAVYEVLWATGMVPHLRVVGYSMALAALIPLWCYGGSQVGPAFGALFVYVLALFAEALVSRFTITPEHMGCACFFAVIIPLFLSALLRVRELELGLFYVALPMVTAFSSDAFALFGGMLFGKHKLAPTLSPKKTVEGAVGGLLGAVTVTLLYGFAMSTAFDLAVSYPACVIYGALGSVISQIGDLSFSYIKRQYHVKDYGRLFPGHGGVLDRFDSVIFCAPLMELLLLLIPAFTR